MSKIRKTEIYKILICEKESQRGSTEYILNELKDTIVLEDFLKYFFNTEVEQKHTVKNKNLCYYIDNVQKDENKNKIILKYILFNKRTNIVDIETLNHNYKKNKNEGDEEKQHYLIKTFTNTNRAVLVWEKVTGAVTIGVLETEINRVYKNWIKKEKSTETDLLKYEIKIKIVPSPKFIEELMKLDKISLVKIVVDKEKLTDDEDIIFSEDNVSRDVVEVLYKPINTLSFSKSKVKNYYKKFENQNATKKVKRMVIEGRKDKNAIRLDTEGMKLSEYIKTEIDLDGLVDTKDIFEKYTVLVDKNFKEYFDNIFINIDIEESEE